MRWSSNGASGVVCMWYQQLPDLRNKPGQQSFSPLWISPACQRSFRIRAGYLTRSSPREHTGWNVLPWDQRKPHHFTCMRIRIRAWPASLGCPSTGFSHPASSWTGRQSIRSLTGRAPCSGMSRDGEPLYLAHAFYPTRERRFCQEIENVALSICTADCSS
jgi:hypothetical protein